MTTQIYRNDAYAKQCTAKVVAVTAAGGIVLDQTVFYASAGGQPGDSGTLTSAGRLIPITATVYDADKTTIVHVPAAGAEAPRIGSEVDLALDWPLRHRLMRMHTALHLLCSLVKFPVTGGQIGADESRLDFDIEDASAIDRDRLTAELMSLVAADHPVTTSSITDAELAASPHLVRTMSVKPPMGTGHVRLVLIGENGGIDLQPCGGTHVARTREIGGVLVTKIEKKGRINRRIRIGWA